MKILKFQLLIVHLYIPKNSLIYILSATKRRQWKELYRWLVTKRARKHFSRSKTRVIRV